LANLIHNFEIYPLPSYSTLPYIVSIYPNRRNYNLKAYGDFQKLQKILETNPYDCGIVIANHQTAVDISTLIQFWGGISKKSTPSASLAGFKIIY